MAKQKKYEQVQDKEVTKRIRLFLQEASRYDTNSEIKKNVLKLRAILVMKSLCDEI